VSRLVPMAAARLKHEMKLRIALLARVEKLAAELREHLHSDIQSDDVSDMSLDDALKTLLVLVERMPVKSEPKPAAE
jgi:hypothetical protein